MFGTEILSRDAHWGKVLVELRAGAKGPFTPSKCVDVLADDAERTCKMTGEHKGPVLLVVHSDGGAATAEARRSANVVDLVYVSALIDEMAAEAVKG